MVNYLFKYMWSINTHTHTNICIVGLVFQRGCVLEYSVVNLIDVKRVLFKLFKLR